MPARETFHLIPAGERVEIAVPDPSRNSLMISSDTGGPITLSTIADGTSTQGIMFNSGIQPPYLITWDLYGALLHGPWYAHNPGASGRNVTVMEVMTRPENSPEDKSKWQPLKKCLKRFQVVLFNDIVISDHVDPVEPGNSCESAGVVGFGATAGPFTCPIGTEHWFRVTVPAGINKVILTLAGGMAGLDVQQGGCPSLHFVSFGNLNPPGGCQQGNYAAGDAWVRVFANGVSTITYSFSLEAGAC